MHTYYFDRQRHCWIVGFYPPAGGFMEESVHAEQGGAAARVHYLNGGSTAVIESILDNYSEMFQTIEREIKCRYD